MNQLPTRYSSPDLHALASYAERIYDLGTITSCRLWNRGLNDTYRLRNADGADYALRIWRCGWRTESQARYELDAICHVAARSVGVASPIERRDGDVLGVLDAPEGPRLVAVTRWASGGPAADWVAFALFFGADVARMHTATEDFKSPHERFSLDAAHLLEEPVRALRAFVGCSTEDVDYVARRADELAAQLTSLGPSLDWGFCHGDFHGGNVYVDGAGALTHFDFDCCGSGWRAYDIATHRWAFENMPDTWSAFLAGYRSIRPLSDADEQAIGLFVTVRHIWWLGLVAANPDVGSGSGWLSDAFLANRIDLLRKWEKEPPEVEN